MITEIEAIRVVQKYFDSIQRSNTKRKKPIYTSFWKKIFIFFLGLYGDLTNQLFIYEKILKPDNWRIIDYKLVILDEGIRETQDCWLISYNSHEYNKSNNVFDLLLGIGFLIIDKDNGDLYATYANDDQDRYEDFLCFKKEERHEIDWENRKIILSNSLP